MQSGDIIANRFELERLAGTGAMGEVWRARDISAGLAVAVKLLAKEDDAGRFLREAVSLSSIDHPGIVRYIAHGELAEHLFLVMEWLEGEDLSRALTGGPLGIDATIVLTRRVAEALAAAHARGIVHRDIKPSNLFLPAGSTEQVKVVDFGIARVKDWTGTWTRNGWILGTPAYMAPEIARGEPAIDARADLFSLGCVAFECLTGRCPFGGTQVMAVLRSVLNDEAPSVRALVPEVPEEIDDLIRRMMAKDRAARPADALTVATALSQFHVLPEAPTQRWRRPALTRCERRFVTTLLVSGDDPSATTDPFMPLGSTEVSPSELDPTRRLGTLLQRTGAKIERLGHDLFLFSLPSTGMPADRAAQMARCALTLGDILPHRMMMLASGRREVGTRTEMGTRTEAGFVKQAARIIATSGGAATSRTRILVDDLSAQWLRDRFELAPHEQGFELESERPFFVHETDVAEPHPSPRSASDIERPFVGRVREIAAIKAIFQESIDETVARALLVTGPPGSGKSRLRRELLPQILGIGAERAGSRVEVWFARGDSMTAGSPFALVSALIQRAARARWEQQDEAVRTERSGGAALAAVDEEKRRALLDMLALQCQSGPVLLVLEDLQWGDLPSIELVDAALRRLRDAPFLVLAFARPEVHELFPNLWAERELEEIRLASLTRSVAERLVRGIVGEAASPEQVAHLLELGEGNPLFLEELARAAEQGHDGMPDTLLAMVHARLDRLDPDTRRVLRAASVFGTRFWRGGVGALLGNAAEVDESLIELAEQRFVLKEATSRFSGDIEYTFGSALVREGAYAMLTVADRALGHDLAAKWLKEMGEADEAVISAHATRVDNRESA